MFYSEDQILRANSTDLAEFLRLQGETLEKSGREFRWKKHDSVTIRDNTWYRHSRQVGGRPIDFVMEFWNRSFSEAVAMLISEDPEGEQPPAGQPNPEFRQPPASETQDNAIRYLTEQRGLSRKLVDLFISSGTVYEDASHHNVVFLGWDKNLTARYAHQRGMNPAEKFRQDSIGSDKAYSFSFTGCNDQLFVFEAPIDLLSFIDLYPKDWETRSYVSLGGVGEKALNRFLQDFPSIHKIYLCLDSDAAGTTACEKFFKELPKEYEVARLIPARKDWNELLLNRNRFTRNQYCIKVERPDPDHVDMIRLADVELTEVQWLWKPYIPFGKLSILQGNPGEGKTYLAMNLAAACTNHAELPGSECIVPFNVIYQTAEDGLGDTVKPRLIEAGADLERVLTINDREQQLTLTDERIEKAILQNNARLLIIDPIQAYIGPNVDMNRANEVRPIFRMLGDVAQRTGCAVLLIGHLNKAAGMQSTYRGLGSIDMTASVRSLLLVGRKKGDPNVRIMTHDKSSLAPPGPSLAFVLGDEEGFRWIGEIDIAADDVLAGCDTKKENSKLKQAIEMITGLLTDGRRLSCAELDRAAMEKGISSRTMRDARAELKNSLQCGYVGHEKYYYIE